MGYTSATDAGKQTPHSGGEHRLNTPAGHKSFQDGGDKASITHDTLKYATASLAPTCVLRGNKFWRATWAFFLYRELCWGQMRQHADTQNKNEDKSSYHKVLFNPKGVCVASSASITY